MEKDKNNLRLALVALSSQNDSGDLRVRSEHKRIHGGLLFWSCLLHVRTERYALSHECKHQTNLGLESTWSKTCLYHLSLEKHSLILIVSTIKRSKPTLFTSSLTKYKPWSGVLLANVEPASSSPFCSERPERWFLSFLSPQVALDLQSELLRSVYLRIE